jgi:RNA polymerase sigma factor (TIGR02999 family)
MSASNHDVTELLNAWGAGDPGAQEHAVGLLYQELRRRAAAHLRHERRDHTLQPSALVHEAYIRLAHQRGGTWRDRAQFLAVASKMMRRILVDRARARLAAKRPGHWAQVPLEDALAVAAPADLVDVLDLDAALDKLAAVDARKSHIAELRFFGGLSLEETAAVLHVSAKTVDRDWQAARALLYKMLRPEASTQTP